MSLQNNHVLPFTMDTSALGGRIVRLHECLDAILKRHDYPHAVSVLLGECIGLGVSLATALKFDGVFTFEARGDGVVPLLVVDITANGAIRGYAQVNGDIPAYHKVQDSLVQSLMGTGHMMITVDQASNKDRYQGIVDLNYPTWEGCMMAYFEKSMQFQSVFRVACTLENNTWRCGCIAIQKLPEESHKHDTDMENENWNRSVVLLKSLTHRELTDITLSCEDILYRLYHQENVRVYPPTALHDTCRCSAEKMRGAIAQIPESERSTLLNEDGVISVDCEYCSTTRTFKPDDIGLHA